MRPSRLHSAVAAATALQTATRRRGTKIRRPVSPKRWRRADGSAKPFLFDSISLLLHPFRFETRRFTPCRFRIAMGGRVLHERNAGGVIVCEAGASHQPMGSPLRSSSPRLCSGEGMGGEGAEPSRDHCAFHPQSSCSPGAKRKRDFDSRRNG